MTRTARTFAALRTVAQPAERVTARKLRAGDVLTRWDAEPVTVVAVEQVGARRWLVVVRFLSGATESATFAAGEPITRRLAPVALAA